MREVLYGCCMKESRSLPPVHCMFPCDSARNCARDCARSVPTMRNRRISAAKRKSLGFTRSLAVARPRLLQHYRGGLQITAMSIRRALDPTAIGCDGGAMFIFL